jgi:hypothetical protein
VWSRPALSTLNPTRLILIRSREGLEPAQGPHDNDCGDRVVDFPNFSTATLLCL